ncbi:hypothetical protein HZH68_012384 [Vespula germanica]|uniref:Uncharacterized protein n=1 Tax=Vespula germanica TaxID=30212 RepID=A0A834MX68_VESGE|nr:hypothetical protein HZH68_012384 [Vespula germanica]
MKLFLLDFAVLRSECQKGGDGGDGGDGGGGGDVTPGEETMPRLGVRTANVDYRIRQGFQDGSRASAILDTEKGSRIFLKSLCFLWLSDMVL